jgi:uncharacterized protein (TIGR02001 family)
MKHIASITTLTLIAAAAMADAAPAVAPASAWTQSGNLALSSNYIWRGVSQNDEKVALQGGFDVAHTSGLSAGVWASNIQQKFGANDANLELDIYANYGFKVSNIDLSVGYIAYIYQGISANNFSEVNVSATYAGVTAKVSKEIANGNNTGAGFSDFGYYYELGYTYSIAAVKGLDLGLHYGWADKGTSADAEDYSVALSYPVAGFVATVSYSNTPGSYVGDYLADSTTAITLKKSF